MQYCIHGCASVGQQCAVSTFQNVDNRSCVDDASVDSTAARLCLCVCVCASPLIFPICVTAQRVAVYNLFSQSIWKTRSFSGPRWTTPPYMTNAVFSWSFSGTNVSWNYPLHARQHLALGLNGFIRAIVCFINNRNVKYTIILVPLQKTLMYNIVFFLL